MFKNQSLKISVRNFKALVFELISLTIICCQVGGPLYRFFKHFAFR